MTGGTYDNAAFPQKPLRLNDVLQVVLFIGVNENEIEWGLRLEGLQPVDGGSNNYPGGICESCVGNVLASHLSRNVSTKNSRNTSATSAKFSHLGMFL